MRFDKKCMVLTYFCLSRLNFHGVSYLIDNFRFQHHRCHKVRKFGGIQMKRSLKMFGKLGNSKNRSLKNPGNLNGFIKADSRDQENISKNQGIWIIGCSKNWTLTLTLRLNCIYLSPLFKFIIIIAGKQCWVNKWIVVNLAKSIIVTINVITANLVKQFQGAPIFEYPNTFNWGIC